jgi:hypothetical protein
MRALLTRPSVCRSLARRDSPPGLELVGACARHCLPTSARVRRYTGKLSGKQDDTVLALQMCLFAVKTYYTSDRYKTYRS